MERVFTIHVDDVVKLVRAQLEAGNQAQAMAILRALRPAGNAGAVAEPRDLSPTTLLATFDLRGLAR